MDRIRGIRADCPKEKTVANRNNAFLFRVWFKATHGQAVRRGLICYFPFLLMLVFAREQGTGGIFPMDSRLRTATFQSSALPLGYDTGRFGGVQCGIPSLPGRKPEPLGIYSHQLSVFSEPKTCTLLERGVMFIDEAICMAPSLIGGFHTPHPHREENRAAPRAEYVRKEVRLRTAALGLVSSRRTRELCSDHKPSAPFSETHPECGWRHSEKIRAGAL